MENNAIFNLHDSLSTAMLQQKGDFLFTSNVHRIEDTENVAEFQDLFGSVDQC